MAVVAAMDGPARMPALGAPAAGCVQSHRDDEVIVVSFDEMRNAALGDGEVNVHASHDGEGGSDHHRPEAIHRHPRKVSKNHRNGAIPIPQGGPLQWGQITVHHPCRDRPHEPSRIGTLHGGLNLALLEAASASQQELSTLQLAPDTVIRARRLRLVSTIHVKLSLSL
ncbi:hypothetical protein Maq22A_2p40950 (plasmid) [Methylobacterium aquaticum]|uniref:Uncharacterized protein n=1 Tax=Methylobacterium aquaticum TaxID=270351 RepID=A0A0C6FWK1_9HYPH|nr:hypothetical protein Maq22A_2p40950 [Methylobacterium aquaticum]